MKERLKTLPTKLQGWYLSILGRLSLQGAPATLKGHANSFGVAFVICTTKIEPVKALTPQQQLLLRSLHEVHSATKTSQNKR